MGLSGLEALAAEVGPPSAGPVTVAGMSTREGGVVGVRCVTAPSGISWFQPDEMTIACGAGTPVAQLQAAAAEHGQFVNLPDGGTVGGALGMGQSGILRLGRGPVRDTVLQIRYISAAGEVVTAGGPTVKNVTGFDLCRLLVGSRGTLGVTGDVILRTRPLPMHTAWFAADVDPSALAVALYRPSAVLWNGTTTWVCLEGHPDDVAAAASRHGLVAVEGPPALPTGGRWSLPPSQLRGLTGHFVAEVGVGVVHHDLPAPAREADPVVAAVERRIRSELDPTGRLSPGRR